MVYEVLKDGHETVAVKVQETDFTVPSYTTQAILGEINFLRVLNHENVIKLLDVFFIKYEDGITQIHSMMEMASQDLHSFIRKKKFTEREIAIIMKAISNGLSYIHSQQIIHRDLKPSNVLVTSDGVIKISDFGLSVGSRTSNESVGTKVYMAPEVLLYRNEYDEKCDVWEAGCILWDLITG